MAVVAPRNLPAAVGPATRLVGLSSGNPLGRGMSSTTMRQLSGGELYTRRWFGQLCRTAARLRGRFGFGVLAGGPGAWQLAADPAAMAERGINCAYVGYGEADAGSLVGQFLRGQTPPPVVRASRRAGRGDPADPGAHQHGRHRDQPRLRAGMRVLHVGLRADGAPAARHHPGRRRRQHPRGGAVLSLISEDFLRDGADGMIVNPAALLDLAAAVPGWRAPASSRWTT